MSFPGPAATAPWLAAWRSLRDDGLRATATKALGALRWYRRLLVVEVPIAERAPRPIVDRQVVARALLAGDAAAFARHRPDLPADAFARRLAAGHQGFAAWVEGALVSSVWAATCDAHIEYLDGEMLLRAGEAYVYDAFTDPALRGRDIASWRTEALKRALRDAGVRRLLSTQLPENTLQGARAARLSYAVLGTVGWIRVAGRRRAFARRRRRGAPSTGLLPVSRELPQIRYRETNAEPPSGDDAARQRASAGPGAASAGAASFVAGDPGSAPG